MTNLTLRDDLVQRLHQIANQEHRRLDDIVETMLDQYSTSATSNPALADELRQDRRRIYNRARAYWQRNNNARQYLSDEDLEQRFWLIDQDGIPRLKEDQSSVELPADPFIQMLETAEADRTVQWQVMADIENTKDILNKEYTDHLLTRLNKMGDVGE